MTLFNDEHHFGPPPPPGIVNEPGVRIIWFDGSPEQNPHGWWASNFAPSPLRLDEFTYDRLAHPAVMEWHRAMNGSPEERVFPTGESAFQAFKTHDVHLFARIASERDPHEAKRMGRELSLRSDWEAVKVDVMREVVRAKFSRQNPQLVKALLASGQATLIEGVTWGPDTTWGVPVSTLPDGSPCVRWGDGKADGANLLGLLVAQRRAELRLGLDRKERRPRQTVEATVHAAVAERTQWVDLLRERRGAVVFEGEGPSDGSMLVHCTAPDAEPHAVHSTSFKPEPSRSQALRRELEAAASRLRSAEDRHLAGEEVEAWV